MLDDSKDAGAKIAETYQAKLDERNLMGTVEFAVADRPGEYLIDQANQLDASMIVMGTRGFGVLRRTILGSVSNYVIHHSKVPVTVVPPETQSWFF
jgi:nucleotide-binding universal stress UspA family protein